MILRFLFLLLLCESSFGASTKIAASLRRKEYQKVVTTYNTKEKWKELTGKELILLSHTFRRTKNYRLDVKLMAFILTSKYKDQHKDIIKKMREKETLDMEDYPKSLPIYYWYLYNDYALLLMQYKNISHPQLAKDRKAYNYFGQILSELEFREGKAEKINNNVVNHLQYLENKVYRFTWSANLQYVSWQHDATLHRQSSGKNTGLIITNSGYCVGGDAGIENGFYHFSVDGCLLVGSGGVSSYGDPNITYKQNTPAFGLKIGPSASMIVSSSKSRIGIGLPLIYTSQELSQPGDPDYRVKDGGPLSALATINSRWQFGQWYIRTEFGQYFKKQESFWGLGFGKQF